VRILLLTTLLPGGPPSGGTLATLELSRRLAAYGEVERWAVWALEASPEKGHEEWRGASSITLRGLRRRGVPRALARGLPLGVARFHRRELATALKDAGPFDVFFADHLGVWGYSEGIRAHRRILYSHNVESEIYERAATLESTLWKRWVWRYEADAMRRFERMALRQADAVICPGTRDKETLRERYGVRAEAWYPPIADAQPVRRKRSGGCVVGSVGSLTWQPNRWGMDWFVQDVWPRVRKIAPDARLRVGGRGSDALPFHEANGVECLGPIDDLQGFYETLDLVVAPIRGGAGIKVKVMDACARGLPVVTTPIGVEGLGEHIPPNVAVAAGAEEFALAVGRGLLSQPDLPIEEGVRWYRSLVAQGSAAVDLAMGTDRGRPES